MSGYFQVVGVMAVHARPPLWTLYICTFRSQVLNGSKSLSDEECGRLYCVL